MSYYNSMLVLPDSDVASPVTATIIPMGSAMMVQASPSSYLCLPQSSSHESLPRLSSEYFVQPSSALYLPQQSSALYLPQLSLSQSPPHPSSYLCFSQSPSNTVSKIMHASPLPEACVPVVRSLKAVSANALSYSIAPPSGSTGCPRCSRNSNTNRSKGAFKRWLRNLLGGRWTCK